MKRHSHILWNALAAVSALTCIITSGLWFRSYAGELNFEFSRHGFRWEVGCRSGRFWLDNEPQRRIEAAQFNARTADLQRGLHVAWGTDPWRGRVAEMHRLEREQAAVATPAAEHAIPAGPVWAIAAVVTAIWIVTWLRRNPEKRRSVMRLTTASSAGFALLLFPMVIAMWVRGRLATDVVAAPTTWHFNKVVLGNGGVTIQTFRMFRRVQKVQIPLYVRRGNKQTMPSIVPIGPYTHGKWGQWDWRVFDLANTTYSQLSWTRSASPPWPRITAETSIFSDGIVGRPDQQIRTREEQLFAGDSLWLPYWCIVVVTGVWPAVVVSAILRWRRAARRRRLNLCMQCGYDLHATPAVCPECGSMQQLA